MFNTKILGTLTAMALLAAAPAYATSASSDSGSASTGGSIGLNGSGSVGVTGRNTGPGVGISAGSNAGASISGTSNDNTSNNNRASDSMYNSTAPAAGGTTTLDADASGQLRTLIDSNNGSLSKAKFMSETDNRYNADLFNQIDGNRDGKISALELQAYQNAATR